MTVDLAPVRAAYVDVAEVARDLIALRATAQHWHEPSTLAQLTVGELAGHLARGILGARPVLEGDDAAPDAALRTASEYFLHHDVGPDLESDLNRAVRDRAVETAAGGVASLIDACDRDLAVLRERLVGEPPDRRVLAYGGVPMPVDEYLVTRIVELAVHGDDLAVSLGVPTPDLDPVAAACVIGCLVDMARRRHGDVAVMRALARRERDDADALRVF